MKTIFYKADSRGHADHGWLRSYHTFSFAGYHNPNRMNFGALRVFNDDVVQPNMGFGTHPHKNMEIISIPLQGALSHKDSMGNKRSIEENEVQVMSAGTGLTHSEFNDSATNPVNFIQLWIVPETLNVNPHYDQRYFDPSLQKNKLFTIVAPKNKNEDNALPINQQAYVYRATLDAHRSLKLQVKQPHNGLFIFVVNGQIDIANNILNHRDALGVYETELVDIVSKTSSELIIVEVPMH